MTPSSHTPISLDLTADEERRAEWAVELADRIFAGDSVDLDNLARSQPEKAKFLRELLPTIELMAALGSSSRGDAARSAFEEFSPLADAGQLRQLGDFQLVREVGRGGMGVVYEARQLSLGRRVALKVLPFGASIDPRQLRRFQLEAQAAALLNHRHIVPVHAVGCERGVHYYAMQFIDGRTLADVVRELRHSEGLDVDLVSERAHLASPRPAVDLNPAALGLLEAAGGRPGFGTSAHGASPMSHDRGFVRDIAAIVKDAAEALDHAHQSGVVHRDIKPANLMLDERGHLWVADFGLARLQDDPGLTVSGDLIGTLRFMSPEQALGTRVIIDHRTDVYSLGVTLYELLTLRPAFGGRDRAETLRRIAEDEPTPPRRLNPSISRDLETVVLKAMAKEPEDRYPTALAMADDLGRVIGHHPIWARRPTLPDRAMKFARRHRPAVAAVAATLVTLTVLAMLAAVQFGRMAAREHQLREQEDLVRKELESRLYFHRIDLADREWEANEVGRMGPPLDACPARLRGWEWYYLKGLRRPRSAKYDKHQLTVFAVAYHPGGGRAVSVATDGAMKIWDPRDGREDRSPEVPASPGSYFDAAYSPDGSKIAAAGDGRKVHIWDAGTGRLIASIPVGPGIIRRIAFSPDGTRIATAGSQDGTSIWDVSTGRVVSKLSARPASVQAVAYSPDGAWVASSSEEGDVMLWDAATGSGREPLRGHNGPVRAIAFSPDGRRIATGGGDGVVKISQVPGGWEELNLPGHVGLVTAVSFSPDGSRLASSSEDGDVRLWDAQTGHLLLTLRGHSGPVQDIAFSPDGTSMISCGDQGDVRTWEVTDLGDDRTFVGHTGAVRCVAYSPDGRRIATGGISGEIRVWDAESGATLATLRGHIQNVYSIAFSPDGTTLASGGKDDQVRVWDVAAARERMTLTGSASAVLGVAFSPDGETIASAGDGRVILWDAKRPGRRRDFGDGTGSYREVAFSPDGKFVAAANWLHTVEVWEVATGLQIHKLYGHAGSVLAVAFSPDGTLLASSGADRTLRIWNLATGREELTLAGHHGFVDDLAFSPDGERIASASWDNTVSLWDTRTGFRALTLRGHKSRVRGIAFSPDGTKIVSVSSDQTARLWRAALAPPHRNGRIELPPAH